MTAVLALLSSVVDVFVVTALAYLALAVVCVPLVLVVLEVDERLAVRRHRPSRTCVGTGRPDVSAPGRSWAEVSAELDRAAVPQ